MTARAANLTPASTKAFAEEGFAVDSKSSQLSGPLVQFGLNFQGGLGHLDSLAFLI